MAHSPVSVVGDGGDKDASPPPFSEIPFCKCVASVFMACILSGFDSVAKGFRENFKVLEGVANIWFTIATGSVLSPVKVFNLDSIIFVTLLIVALLAEDVG